MATESKITSNAEKTYETKVAIKSIRGEFQPFM